MADLNEVLKQANEHFGKKEFKEAAELFGQLLGSAPESYKGKLALQQAVSLFNSEQPEKALDAFKVALESKDKDVEADAAAGKVRALDRLGKTTEAEVAYEEYFKLDPKGEKLSWAEYAQFCNNNKMFEKTLDVAAKGLENQPADFSRLHVTRIVAYFRLEKPLDALEDVESVLKKKSVSELQDAEKQIFSEVLLQHGQKLMNENNLSEAKTFYQKAFDLSNSAQSCYLIGVVELRAKNDTAALKRFEQTLSFDPQFWRAHVVIGTLHMKSDPPGFQQAVDNFDAALKLSNGEANDVNLKFQRGYALYMLERSEEAKEDLIYVYKNDISNWRSHALLGTIYISNESWEDAVELLSAAIDNSNGEAEAPLLFNLAYAYMMLNRYKEAKEYFEKSAAKDPAKAEQANALASKMAEAQKKEEAEIEEARQQELAQLELEKEAERLRIAAEEKAAQAQKEKDLKIRKQKEEAARVEQAKAQKILEEKIEAEKEVAEKKKRAIIKREQRLKDMKAMAGSPQSYRARRPSLDLIPRGNTSKNANKYANWFNENIARKT